MSYLVLLKNGLDLSNSISSQIDLRVNHNKFNLNHYFDSMDRRMADLLSYELSKRFYYYGDHFKNPTEGKRTRSKEQLKNLYIDLKVIFSTSRKGSILSNAYFDINNILRKHGEVVYYPPWGFARRDQVLGNWKLRRLILKVRNHLETGDFFFFESDAFGELIENLKRELTATLISEEVKAVVLCNDLSFFENLTISVCKEVGIPTFIFLHGLPGRYNGVDDNRADYLFVWSQKIKDLYVKSGVSPQKILVSGHPAMEKYHQQRQLRFGLENILVLTSCNPGAVFSDYEGPFDRTRSINYLYSIKETLSELGVKQVRFRPHPSENVNWYTKYLDASFFRPDVLSLKDSLSQSSLVIGPTSTVFLEALMEAVNYVVFEPLIDDFTLVNFKLVPPFDGSEAHVPVAHTAEDLYGIMEKKQRVGLEILERYAGNPFQEEKLISIINESVLTK